MAAKFIYPLSIRGSLIGVPYKGTHTLYGNWESDNAVDISVPAGTPVFAVADGVIGPQIGPLSSSDPKLQGLRLHLVTAGNEVYYAHLSRLAVKAGDHVRAGQIIGYSGSANGVDHLHIAFENGNPETTFEKAQQAAQVVQAAVPQATPPPTPQAAPEGPDFAAPAPVVQPAAQLGIIPEIAYPGQPDLSYVPRQPVADTWRLIANQPFSSPHTQDALTQAQLAEGLGGG